MRATAWWREAGRLLLPAVAVAALVALVGAASRFPRAPVRRGLERPDAAVVAAIDRGVAARWEEAGIEPAAAADELAVLRRAWLALAGTIPSIEEVRRFEADAAPNRLARWIGGLLTERRSAEYLAGRLARVLAGAENGPFLVFRRDRFTAWLADAIHANRPLDEIVVALVSDRGLWTDTPAVNFITQAQANGSLDADVLAARVARCFLGQRIDCAQCHDHPFAPITQRQFEGLAAHFAQARITGLGLEDDPRRVHRIEVPPPASPEAMAGTMAAAMASAPQVRNVPPRVPFGAAWLPQAGTHRARLAGWIVHPENRRFDRALANRLWQFVFGRAWHEPVDDLPDPGVEAAGDDPVDVVAAALRDQGRDLRRILLALTATRLFQLDSRHPLRDDPETCARVDAAWGAFPLTPLHPEQLIAGLSQATSLHTIDTDAHLLQRTIRFFRTLDFVRDFGRPGDDAAAVATVPQSLLRMNGRLTRELTEANPFTAAGRIAGMAADDDAAVELVYLLTLSRRPTAEERSTMRSVVDLAPTRGRGLEDVCWALVNAAEFAWNH